MRTNYLLPNRFKKPGWTLLIVGLILGLVYLIIESEPKFLYINTLALANYAFLGEFSFFSIAETNFFDEIIGLLLIIGSIFIALSKERYEDEFITRIRLESLVWATYVNYAILIIAILFVFEFAFFWVLVFNMFTMLFFFIIRFNWAINKSKNMIPNEK